MMCRRLNVGLGALVVVGVSATLVIQHLTQAKLCEKIRSLREQMAELQTENQSLSNCIVLAKKAQPPRLPTPPVQTDSPTPTLTEGLQVTNLFGQFGKEPPKLTAEQVEAYLKANGRKASILLAAYRTSGDPALLAEAMQNYPADPHVAFEAVIQKNLSPELRRQWLNTFEQVAPDNALANYLSARDYFKAGQTEQAVQELVAASSKPQFQGTGSLTSIATRPTARKRQCDGQSPS